MVLKALANSQEYIWNNTQKKTTEALDLTEENWMAAFKDSQRHSSCARTQALLFEIYAGIAYTNKSYKRFGHKSRNNCTFCDEEEQSFGHLFRDCQKVKSLREAFTGMKDIRFAEDLVSEVLTVVSE